MKRRAKHISLSSQVDEILKPVYDMYILGMDEVAQTTFKKIDRNLFYAFNRLKRKMM